MADLSEMLSQILSSDEGKEKVNQMLAMFTGQGDGGSDEDAQPQQQSGDGGLDLGMLMKLQPMIAQLGKENENTALLRALRPHMTGDNVRKIDEAIRVLQLLDALPLLKSSGILGDLFGGDGR